MQDASTRQTILAALDIANEMNPQATDGTWLEDLTVQAGPIIKEWDIDECYHWSEWPEREDHFPNTTKQDVGIDAVAVRDGEYVAIQCKARKLDEHGDGAPIGKGETDKFANASADGFWAERWIVTNGNVPLNSNTQQVLSMTSKPVKLVNITNDLLQQQTAPTDEECLHCAPNPDGEWRRQTKTCMQSEAIAESVRILREHEPADTGGLPAGQARGKIILPCGTGKTRISLRIIEELTLPGELSVVLCPSIALVAQIRREYLQNANTRLRALAVCSDQTAGYDPKREGTRDTASDPTLDNSNVSASVVKGKVTTDPSEIARWIGEGLQSSRISVIFGTYQSGRSIADALHGAGVTARVLVADEAHRTAGLRRKKRAKSVLLSSEEKRVRDFTLCHDNDAMPATFRVYQTATPRVYDTTSIRIDHNRVMAAHLDSATSYAIRVTMDNADIGFDSLCTDRTADLTVPTRRSSHTAYLTLYGCDTSGGTVSATLLAGSATVATATPVSVAVTPPSMITSSPASPYTGQRVTLRASSPSSYGTASSYQWQEWSNGQWTNLGSASTSRRYSTKSTSAQTRTFRVVVTYTSGETESSAWVAVEWRSIVVTVAASPDNPESADASKRKVTLTATADAPSGATYQWQQGSGSNWTNLGSPTTSATREVSFTTRGTRKFRVQLRHTSASSAVSEPVYVTWDEWAIVAEMVTALQKAVTGDSTYVSAQKALVDCMNTGTGGASGAGGGNATSTPPTAGVGGASSAPTPTFTSFDDILAQYTGATKAKMDGDGNCHVQATSMFNAAQEASQAQINKLKTGDTANSALYAALLETPHGAQYETNVGASYLVRGVAYLRASQLADTPNDGATGTSETGGLACLPARAKEPTGVQAKLDVLNCLIFGTPHNFWVKSASQLKQQIDQSHTWLGYGDWKCTPPSWQGPVPSCLKHDVAFGSLQKFAGETSSEDADSLDLTWNPRNKHLADFVFMVDIATHGCQQSTGLPATVMCNIDAVIEQAYIMHWGVSRGNNKSWPVTGADISDAEANPKFVSCDTPRVQDVRVWRSSRFLHDHFNVGWGYRAGCLSEIEVERYKVCWDTTIAGIRDEICEFLGPESNDARLSQLKLTARSVKSLASIAIRPTDIRYGGLLLGLLKQFDEDTIQLFEWLSSLSPLPLTGIYYPDQFFGLRYE